MNSQGMEHRHFEHSREVRLERGGGSVELVLETASREIPPAAENFARDLASSLAMHAGRMQPFPAEVRVRFDDLPGGGEAPGYDAPPLMETVKPRFTLDDFICEPFFRRVLDDVVFYARHYPEIRAQMGVEVVTRSFLVNFHGPSGTGKTMAAEALANELGRELHVMNFANVESSLLGRTPKNINRAFREIDPGTSVILLDEADAFVSRRIADLRQGAEYALNAARGQIIQEIDRFDGLVILATNLFGTYDHAILRRIKFNLLFELPPPDAVERMFSRYLAGAEGLADLDTTGMAAASSGLSGGDIYNISEIIVMKALQRRLQGESAFSGEDIERILNFYRMKTQQPGSVRIQEGDGYRENSNDS